jgi:glycine cleavage system H protein
MSNVPVELKYTKDHEWINVLDDGNLMIGITEHAQDLLGDMVFIEVPEAGSKFEPGQACAVVESVKAASDVYCPIAGEIIEGNETLADAPETVNTDPFGEGWIFKLKPSNPADVETLMDADAYNELLASEDH